MQRLRRTLTVVAVVVTAGVAYLVEPAAPAVGGEPATVGRIRDGDSFAARVPGGDGGEVDVRMIGVNAPDRGECLHDQARQALVDMVGDGEVRLEEDVTDVDRYDRLLRWVYADGVNTNVRQVERGLALTVPSDPDVAHESELSTARLQARNAGLGIWDPNACGPAATLAVRIVSVESDPPGRDARDLNGEQAVLRNEGGVPVVMTGWRLRDDSTRNRFGFPDGFTLGPGAEVVVHVGSGTATATDLYWGNRFPLWGNRGDTALLLDPIGNAVSIVDVLPT